MFVENPLAAELKPALRVAEAVEAVEAVGRCRSAAASASLCRPIPDGFRLSA